MALKLAETTEQGIPIPDAYHKIEEVNIRNGGVNILTSIYYNATTRIDKPAIKGEMFRCESSDTAAYDKLVKGVSPDSADFVSRCYFYLKQSVAKFSTAVDV